MDKKIYDLTNPQKSIWYMEEYYKGTAINNICGSLTINEEVDFEKFKKAINLFVKLNESFQIRLFIENSIPKQYFCEFKELNLEIIDINSNDEILNIEKEMVNIPFNMIESPLFEFRIFRLPNGHGGFVVNTHHIISDAATIAIIGSSIARIYANLKNNIEIDTNIPSYVDYIASEKEYLLSDKFKKDEQYWNDRFETIPDVASLPASFKNVSTYSSNSKRELFILPKSIVDKIRELCSKEKISVFNFFMAVYALYIGRVSNSDEFVIGTPILNRTNFKEKNTSGMFISTVPLKIEIDNNSTFLEFVSNIAKDSLSMLRHQKYPYQYLLENLRNKYNSVPNLYDTLISYQITKTIDKTIDLPYSVHWVEANEISCGINIHIHDNDDSGNLTMCYDYLIDKYSSSDIISTHNRILNVVEQLLNNINIFMKDIDIVTVEEKNKLLYDFNNTKTDYPKDKGIVDLFEEQVEKTPDNIAVVFENQSLTYRELNEKANSLAHHLLEHSTTSDKIVGILLNRSLEMIISILAVLKSGKAYIPIDPDYPVDRILYMLEDSNCNLVLSVNEIYKKLNLQTNFINVSLNENAVYNNSTCNLNTKIDSNSLSYIIYTSGSTGKPKGVMLTHKGITNLVNYCNNYIEYLKNNVYRAIVSVTTISFDIFFFESIISLQRGLKLVIANQNQQTIPRLLANLIENENIEIIQTTPSRMKLLIDNIINKDCISNLKYVILAGEQFPITLANRLRKIKGITLYNGYGPSETTVFSTLTDVTNVQDMTIGKPLDNTQIYIVNKNLNLCPIGISGEICISGDGVGHGYINKPDLTEKSFISNPFNNNSLLYKTGDLGFYNEDGTITCLGRIDNQVKIRGLRIELEEIEKSILEMKEIKDCVVVKKQNDDGHEFLCAYYVKNSDVKVQDIRKKLQSSLTYYMIPQYFVELDTLPYTPNGKIDKKLLPMPKLENNVEIVIPTNEQEKILKEIFEDVLHQENISIEDDFFKLGGDSLSAINLSVKIYDKFNVQIGMKNIFDNPTIKLLSDLLKNINKSENMIEKAEQNEYYPASSAQKRIYFSCYGSEKNTITYNIPGGIILDTIPDIDKLENCFIKLIKRHESFRTYFDIVDGNVVQKIIDNVDFKLNVSSANYKDLDFCFKNFVKPFNLKLAPLFRTQLVKFENDKCLLLFDMHHIISDGTSLKILIDELSSLYNNENLEELPLTYKDFAVWESSNIKSHTFDESKNYWMSQFKDEIPLLNMPTNYPRPAEKSFKGSKVYKTLDSELTNKINELALNTKTTPYMILLSAYYILLSKYTMQDDIVIGSPVIGRDNLELSNIIGMFVNTLPLHIKIDGNYKFNEFLDYIKNLCLSSFEHQTYPLDELVNNLNITRDTSRNPLFDVLFTYQNGGLNSLNLGDIKSKYYMPDTKISKFDLSLEIIPSNDVFNINFEYCTKLFNEDFIENLSEHYINILKVILNNIDIRISNIDMLFTEEKNRILHNFNKTQLEYPDNQNLVTLFKDIVAKCPNNIAVQVGEKSITYKELDQKSNTLALEILNRNVKKGDVIGVCINKSIELVISIWAILKVGCVYMPMYVGYPKDRLDYMIKNSNCKLLILNSTMKDIIDKKCEVIDIVGFEKIENTEAFSFPFEIMPSDLAYIIYTSGSTGKPKGVQIMHKNLINYVLSFNELFKNISPKDKFLSSTNISFDVSIWELFLSILNGATLVLYTEEIINNILEYCRVIIDYKITTLYIPPNILEEVFTMLKNSKDVKISKLLVGVEPIKKSTLNKYYDLNPNIKIINGYGPTETTICSTALEYEKDEKNDDIVSIGKPLHNTNIYIVDKNMNIVPIGVTGELCISGNGVGAGYINNDTETNNHFVNNIFDDSSKLYKTGDLAKWNSDGTISYVSRKDSQVKLSGYRIELQEIDYTIMQYPSIMKCLTTIYNTGKKSYLVTYFTSDKNINTSDLSAYLQSKLAFYMVPSIYIQLEAFPLTVNGKIDKAKLPKPVIMAKNTYVAPVTELEKQLCILWQDLFNIDKIGIDDNFFELGGDSLSAIKFQVEALNQDLNISYSDIFKFPTIRLLAQKAENNLPSEQAVQENYDYTNINELLSSNDINNVPSNIKMREVNSILLTGSTGFLGAHILDNYLSSTKDGVIYCFVRRKNMGNPEERLQKTLEFYFGNKYDKMFGTRIKVVTADITIPDFGLNTSDYEDLAKKVDVVINSAALVKHYGEYEQFNSINVLGTQRLIDFCKTFNKKLYHISTTSVSGMGLSENNIEQSEDITYFSEKDLYKNQNLNNTYIRTKFEAEKLILENINSGLDACIFRMGNISNRYSDAKFQINVSENAFVNRIKSILKLQVIQEGFKAHATEFAPVDLCADAIIKVIKSNPKFTVFHIFNTNLISFVDIVKYLNELNIKLDFVTDEKFSAKVNTFLKDSKLKNAISGIVTDLDSNKLFNLNANILLDCDFTNLYLQKVGFKWPKINKNYISKYIEYFRNLNYFD